jgi:uncharacterized protein YjiS (DUF1127 family)
MFDRILNLWDTLREARERRANIRYFAGLSDQVLRDIGVERYEIEAMFDRPKPGRSVAAVAARDHAASFAPCG